ncbi:MAG: carbohydrate-binding protein, partial [Armatimonadota bacterium]
MKITTMAFLAAACLLAGSGARASDVYVAPGGSDTNHGTAPKPFATLQAAVNRLRPGDTLLIRGGVYREAVTFPRSGEPGRPITVKACRGEKVVIAGCEPIAGWTLHDAAKGIWKAPMPWTLGSGRNQVFANGEALIEARFPNEPAPGLEMPVAGLSKLWPTLGEFSVPDPEKQPQRVTSKLLDRQPDDYWKGALYYGVHHGGWSAQTGVIEGSKSGELTVGDRTGTWWSVANNYAADDGRGMIVGHMNALDQPGEWHWQDKTLYLIPTTNGEPRGIEAKRRQIAFDLTGRSHIRLEGLCIRGASMLLKDSSYCIIDRCELTYISHYTRLYASGQVEHGRDTVASGETGIVVGGHDNAFRNSLIRYSAGAGLYLSGVRQTVHNCWIDQIDYSSHYLYALNVASQEDVYSGGHTFTYNTFSNCGRSWYGVPGGSWCGASRERAPFLTQANLFAHNHGYNGMLQTRDAGCITGGGSSGGNLNGVRGPIMYNVLHDCFDLWGIEISALGIIYLDLGCNDVDLNHNLLWAAPGSLQRGFYYNTACANVRESDNVFHQEFTRSCAELKPEDFPGGKPFRFGHDFVNPPPLPKWPQLTQKLLQAEGSATQSPGVTRTTDGRLGLRDGSWFTLDGVDLSQGWQTAIMRFASDVPEMNADSSVQAAPRHQKATDPLILDCSVLAGPKGYDEASPGVAQFWTRAYNLSDGNWLRFNKVPLGDGYRRFRAVYGNGTQIPAQLEVRLDAGDGPLLTRVALPYTHKPEQGPITYEEVVAAIPDTVTGTHDVFLVFRSPESKPVVELEYFRFEQYRGEIPLQKDEVKVEVRLGGPKGEKIGEFHPRFSGGADVYAETPARLEPAAPAGPQKLCFVVRAAPLQSWQVSADLAGKVRDGIFEGKVIAGLDPFVFFPRASASLEGAPAVRVRMKTAAAGSGIIYYGTRSAPGFSADRISERFAFVADGQWHEYDVGVTTREWVGDLTTIRLDLDGLTPGATVSVDNLTLVSRGNDIARFDFREQATPALLSVDRIALQKACQPMDMVGVGVPPLQRNGRFVYPEPTNRPLPPDARRLPSRLRAKLSLGPADTGPRPQFRVMRLATAPTIDGKLDEWPVSDPARTMVLKWSPDRTPSLAPA